MHRLTVPASIASALLASACSPYAACEEAGDICTIAGVPGEARFSEEGIDAREAALYLPQDAAQAPDGRLYLVDYNNHRLRRIEEDGTVTTVAGTGFLGDGPEGPGADFAFNHPTDIAFSPDDPSKLYIAAWHNSRINVLDLDHGTVSFECGTGGRAFGGDGGPAKDAVLDLPVGIVFDSAGTLIISDQANQVIRRVDHASTITTIAGIHPDAEGVRQNGFEGRDGAMADAVRFNGGIGQQAAPTSRIAIHEDVVYLADTFNHLIRSVDLETGVVHTVAGTEPEIEGNATELKDAGALHTGFSGEGDPAVGSLLLSPRDVAVAGNGTLYIADTDNHCVRAVDGDGIITTVAGVCTSRGFDGDGGPATEALLDEPYGITLVDDDSALVIADTYNHVFRKVLLK
ncbi:MAG: hypothetical protein H6732_11075 [Alphaproteobacteria bacterium]|nr:hypothetical protein [Alphaproteobacteria bacterium]